MIYVPKVKKCLQRRPSSGCGRSRGKAFCRPIPLRKLLITIERVESADNRRHKWSGLACNFKEIHHFFNRLVSLDSGVFKDGQVGALGVSQAQELSEGEVILHDLLNIID